MKSLPSWSMPQETLLAIDLLNFKIHMQHHQDSPQRENLPIEASLWEGRLSHIEEK